MIKITKKYIFKKGIQFFIVLIFLLFNIVQIYGVEITTKENNLMTISSENSSNNKILGLSSIELWNKTFGGTNNDWGYSIEKTSDNGSILIGLTQSFGAGDFDAWMIKTDNNGNVQWNSTFGGLNNDYGTSVLQDSEEGYILVGQTESYGKGLSDLWIIKIDLHGNEIWNKTYGGSDADGGFSIKQSSNDSYVICGFTGSYGSDSNDMWLLKIDNNGNEIWNKTYGGINNDFAYSVQSDSNGEFILVGRTESYGQGGVDGWIVKTDSNGNEQWNSTFGSWDYDCLFDVKLTNDGGYIFIGDTVTSDNDLWIVKTNSIGEEEWNKTFGGNSSEIGYSLEIINNEGYLLAGYTNSFGAGNYDAWIIKTDFNGDELWNKTFGGNEDDRAYSLIQISDSEFLFTGYTESYGAGFKDIWLVKFLDQSKFKLTFLFGYVTNITSFDNLIKFKAQNLFYLNFRPLNFGSINSGKEMTVQQVVALKLKENPSLIFGFYKTSL